MNIDCKKHSQLFQKHCFICLEKGCPKNGPVCPFCFTESHSKHKVIPIPTFINSLKEGFPTKCDILKYWKDKTNSIGKSSIEIINVIQIEVNEIFEKYKQNIRFFMEENIVMQLIRKSEKLMLSLRTINFKNEDELRALISDFNDIENIVHLNKDLTILKLKSHISDLNYHYEQLINSQIDTFRQFKIEIGSKSSNLTTILKEESLNLSQPLYSKPTLLTGHLNEVRRILDLGNSLIASCSQDSFINIWNLYEKRCIKNLKAHKGQIYDIFHIPEKNILFSASQDQTIKIWNCSSWRCVRSLRGHEGWVGHLLWSNKSKLLYSGGCDKKIRIWNTEDGESERFPQTDREIYTFEIGWWEKKEKLIVGDISGILYIFDKETKEREKSIQAHDEKISKIQFYKHNSKKFILTCSNDKFLKLWNANTLEKLKSIELHSNLITDFSFVPKNLEIISCGFDGKLNHFDLKTFQIKSSFKIEKDEHILTNCYIPSMKVILYSLKYSHNIMMVHF